MIFEKTGGRIESVKTGKSIAMSRKPVGNYTFSIWVKRGKASARERPVEEVLEGGPRSVVGVFSLNTGNVVTKKVVGAKTYPMWDGEGLVKKDPLERHGNVGSIGDAGVLGAPRKRVSEIRDEKLVRPKDEV